MEKCDWRKEESTKLLKTLEQDLLMTTHPKAKLRQQPNPSFQLRLQLNGQLNDMDEVRICNASTSRVEELQRQYRACA